MSNAIVFDVPTILKLSFYVFDKSWFSAYELPDVEGIKKVEVGQITYFLRASQSDES